MKEFHDFPKYEQLYKNAFKRMLEEKIRCGKDDITGKKDSHIWKNEQDVFDW